MKKRQLHLGLAGLLTIVFLIPQMTMASSTDYNTIISDAEAIDHQTMTQVEIRDFLRNKNSRLANYFYLGYNPSPYEEIIPKDQRTSVNNKQRSASEIIYNAAYEAKINPKFLLTMLQKEMGLVEDSSPTERQLAFAMGYACPDSGGCDIEYRGFGRQVRSSALQVSYDLEHVNQYRFQPGHTACIGDPNDSLPCTASATQVIPSNKITSVMYRYTPHIHGNQLFKTIWDRYDFASTPDFIASIGIIPEGSLVKARDGEDTDTIYLIHNNQRRPFASISALVSRFELTRVLPVASIELDKFAIGNLIQYPAGSILEGPDGSKYLLDGLQKRKIVSDEVFRNLGFNPEEIEVVSSTELATIENGLDIDDLDVSPLEQLLRDPSTGGVYYAKDGKKYPIVNPEIIDLNYPDLTITNATPEQLTALRKLLPVKIKDGTLVISEKSNQVYVIADGKRRWVSNEQTFIELGYSWANIKQVSDRVLKLHKVGEQLSL